MLKLHRIYIEEKRALAAKQKASSMKARATIRNAHNVYKDKLKTLANSHDSGIKLMHNQYKQEQSELHSYHSAEVAMKDAKIKVTVVLCSALSTSYLTITDI